MIWIHLYFDWKISIGKEIIVKMAEAYPYSRGKKKTHKVLHASKTFGAKMYEKNQWPYVHG